jgi:Flp pilus assembly protein TadD
MNISNQINSAQKYIETKQYKQAHQCLIELLQFDKYQADGYFLLAIIASEHGNFKKAIVLIEQAMVLAPDNAEYIAHLAKHYALTHDYVKAKKYCQKAASFAQLNSLTLDTIGVAYSKIGLHDCAIKNFEKAVALAPNNAIFHFNLAVSLKFTGDFDSSKCAFEKTIDLAPNYYKAYSSLSSLGDITPKYQDKILSLDVNKLLPDEALYVGHAQARIYEKQKEYNKAFQTLNNAKKEKIAQLDYSVEDDKKLFLHLKSVFSQQQASQVNDVVDEPIFVVGMPRSGTTLVERILSNHADVTSAGELQNFGLLVKELSATPSPFVIDPDTIDAASSIDFKALAERYVASTRFITGATARFVDKMPLNFLYVGFIVAAFPHAKIVCLDRNPLDSIVSNFRQLFSVNFSYYNYAYDLETTTEYYLLFKDLIAFWQDKYPQNFYVVNYQTLVNSPVKEAKKLVRFCQLSWQDSLVNIENNTAPVATASAVQVRSPINNKSIGNWQRYSFCLEKVIARLQTSGVLID